MADYPTVIFFSLIGGLFSLIGGVLLLSRKSIANKLAFYATPFAAGALLSAVFLDLLPDGIEEGDSKSVFMAVLVGILSFFIAERFLRWFHHHHAEDDSTHGAHKDPSVSLIIAGDIMHNALDGVAIASAFLISVPTGIVTTIAIAAHEIPQEIGDFGLLLNKGMSRKNVLIVNMLSALVTTVMAIGTFALGSAEKLPIGILLGLSAGFLLYIALSDIIPTIHANADASKFLQIQTALLVLGVVTVGLTVEVAHGYIHTDEHQDSSQVEHVEDDHDQDHAE